MLKKLIWFCFFAFFSNYALAAQDECQKDIDTNNNSSNLAICQANSFINIYSSFCLKYLNQLDILENKLANLPKLPPEKAQVFLNNIEGNVWPVPDKYGMFLLAISSKKNFCTVYGRRADTEMTQQQFLKIVSTAPAPMIVKQRENKQEHVKPSGLVKTLAYEWSLPNAPIKMVFMLSTAASQAAEVQVVGSSFIVRD